MRGGVEIMNVDQNAISIQYGDVDGDYNCEKIILFGTPYGPRSARLFHYMDDTKLRFELDLQGYGYSFVFRRFF